MAFYTSLSGLNAAQIDLNTTSNNIANSSTTGFKASRAQFGDLIQGVRLKSITQEFGQGPTQTTNRSLDLMVAGEGFFVTKSQNGGTGTTYTRDGAFTVDSDNNVVNGSGAVLQVLPVDTLGNVTATGQAALSGLHVADTHGLPVQTSAVTQTITLPDDAAIVTGTFDKLDPTTYSNAASVTTYDSAGSSVPMTSYYVHTGDNTWDVHTFIGDKEVFPTGSTTAQTLTFDDSTGAITSPTSAIAYGTVSPTGAAAPMTVSVDYGTATKQGSYAFTQVASSQNGNTVGKLTDLSVDKDGLVSASYSDSATVVLGKIAMATFTSEQGLRQAGNASWTQTGLSGEAKIGAAGTDGRGSISSGALETSNVDLTQQLVQLISAQRNFQANAKAIDTDKQMVQSVLQIQ